MDETKIKEILLKENYISQEDAIAAEKYAALHKSSLIGYLLEEGVISQDLLGQAVAESFGVPFMDLRIHTPTKEDVLKLPEGTATALQAVVVVENKKNIVIATAKPDNPQLQVHLKKVFPGRVFVIAYAPFEDIKELYILYRKKLVTRFGEIIKGGGKVAPEIIDQIVEDALGVKASDIHFEPRENIVVIRFRVDGVLAEAGEIEKQYYENIVNRIKVQAKLRIDEHQSAQDGAIRFSKNEHAADLRISIIPTLDGEKIVIRLLAAYVREILFSGLGFTAEDEKTLLMAAKKPFGMILVTGPTGNGKTTTLYSLVKSLARPEVNITTIEDPIEYKVVGINQIQVNQQTNLTFAKGLRSIARQDPDIILVGEIRDMETAEIAVNAALTGHLLLSTFHANDASSVVPRLLDMGIEPFLLASTLDLIVAQRLVRKVCESCRISRNVTNAEIKKISLAAAVYFKDKSTTLYGAKGCSVCGNTGFKGRVGVFELLQINSEIQDLIVTNPASNKIYQTALSQGFCTMWDDGLKKVRSGQTTLEELLRVVQPPTMVIKKPVSMKL